VNIQVRRATPRDAGAIAAVRLAAARDLTFRFGQGSWSHASDSEAGIQREIEGEHVFQARTDERIVATFRLSSRNPWLGDTSFFSNAVTALYLTSMAVLPEYQRAGVGRQCIEQAVRVAREWPAGAIRLDSYDAPAGAADFYRKCGFVEMRRGDYHGTALIWFERLIREHA
jgi:GNAT superfamily N-acetyltransferase